MTIIEHCASKSVRLPHKLRYCASKTGGLAPTSRYLAVIGLSLLLAGCLAPGSGSEVSIANWPDGHKSAVAITFDMEVSSSPDLKKIADVLKSKNVNATFFIVSGYFQYGSGELDAIKDYEVASLAWNQSTWVSGEMTQEFQQKEIEKADSWLRSNGIKPSGFRAPFLKSNEATFRALEKLDYKYDSSAQRGFTPYRNGKILEIPLSLNFDLYWDEASMRYSTMPGYLAFQESYNNDGLFTFYTHTNRVTENLQNFSRFLYYVQSRNNVWIASCKEIADWWTQRENLELIVEDEKVTVINKGDGAVRGATLKIKGGLTERYFVLPEIEPRSQVAVEVK